MICTWICLASTAFANPVDGVVSAGSATITTAAQTVNIQQISDKAVIDWRGFDIAAGETTEFQQPSSNAIALNRVNSTSASAINGTLKANGNVVIINQNGVAFGKDAKVDVNGLVAATSDTSNDAFINNQKLELNIPGKPDATISNAGAITARDSGLVGFVAPNVENSGVITARLGRVHLAAGDKATVDFYGDGLLEVEVSDAVHQQMVKNSGSISADGGKIALTAATGRNLLASTIEAHGTLRAQAVSEKGGVITISALGSNAVAGNVVQNKDATKTISNVSVEGAIDVSGKAPPQKGGAITITADRVTLKNGAHLDASGNKGGGSIKVGGDYQGKGTTPTAKELLVLPGARIDNNALQSGDGGQTIFWSDGATYFGGEISARGGEVSGNGGFVEVSGKNYLDYQGFTDTRAFFGEDGTLLLDPTDLTISNAVNSNITGASPFDSTGAGTSNLNVTTLQTALAGGNVTITSAAGVGGLGNITFVDPVSWNSTRSLTATATNNLTVNAAITNAGTGGITLNANVAATGDVAINAPISTNGSITVLARRDLTLAAGQTLTTGATGGISLRAANGTTTNTGNLTINGNLSTGTGALTLLSGVNGTRPNYTATTTNLNRIGANFGTVNIQGFQDLTINRILNSSGNNTLLAFRDLNIGASGTVGSSATGNLSVRAANGVATGTGNLNISGILQAGTGSLTLLSGINGTRPNWVANATSLVRLGATFGAINIQGFNDVTIARPLNSTSTISFSNNIRTLLQDVLSSSGNTISFSNAVAIPEAQSATVSTTNRNITFSSTVTDTSGGVSESLTVNSGTATTTFSSALNGVNLTTNGGIVNLNATSGGTSALGTVSLNAINTLNFTNITAANFSAQTSAATSRLAINGSVTSTGSSTPITISSNGILVKSGTGNITSTNGAINLSAGNYLYLANNFSVLSNGGAISFTAPSNIITTNSITVNSSGGNVLFNGPLAISAPLTLTLGSGNLTFNSTINGNPNFASTFSVLAVGAGGGSGGTDAAFTGAGGGGGGVIDATINTINNTLYTVAVGGGGGAGQSSVANTGGGLAGINGGAAGGNAGATGVSGGGGGGGGFSGVYVGTTYYAVAGGGAGGGGGNEGNANDVATPGGGSQPNGANGTSTSGTAGTNFSGDGGGGGGGGGGRYGGRGQNNLTTTALSSGGGNFGNAANPSNTLFVGNSGNTAGTGAAGGAAVAIPTARASYYAYGNNLGFGGDGVANTNGSDGVVIIRYTGDPSQAVIVDGTVTTVGGDTIITYDTPGTTGLFSPITGCLGSCNLTITAGTVNFGGSIGQSRSIDALSINATNGFILPTTNAGTVSATGRTYLNGDITTPNGAVTFNSPVYLLTNSAINTGTGAVTFASTIDSLPSIPSTVQALVVAGGGGGGGGTGGGGGAGGVLYNASLGVTANNAIAVTVGTGGTGGGNYTGATTLPGNNGTNSIFSSLTAIGGGGGGANNAVVGRPGGSGGGGAHDSAGGVGTAGQGNSGGTGLNGSGNYGASGGGGASSAGTAGTTTQGGNGGAGIANSITGSSVTYGGGGGGGIYQTASNFGLGGAGGGGRGGATGTAGANGTNGLGGGGGGAGNNVTNGGTGGSGVVIVRYTGSSNNAIASGGTITTVGGDTVVTFNSSGSFTPVSGNCGTGCGLTINAGSISFGGAVGSTTTLGDTSFISAAALTLPAINAATIFAQTSNAATDITLSGNLSASTTLGDSIVLAAIRDINNSTNRTLTTAGTARWLLYSGDTANATQATGGLSGFNRYGCTYGGSCPTGVTIPANGNGFIYAFRPSITITPSTQNIIYGNTISLTGYGYNAPTVGQYLSAADFAADTLSGSLNGTTSYIPGAVSGSVGTYNINYASGSLTSALGYDFVYGNSASAINVTPRTVTASLTGLASKTYDGNIAATLTGSNYSLSNVFAGDVLGISNTSGTYDTRNAGTGKTVTVTGLNLTGAPVANYVLSSSTASGNIGTITQRSLTIGATSVGKVYDGTINAPVSFTDNRVAGDVLTIGFGAALFPDKNVGVGRLITVSGITLSNTDAGNYSFNTSATTNANITQRALTINATSAGKVYDGTATAPVSFTDNRVAGDVLTIGFGSALFPDKNVGVGRLINVSGITLSNTDSGNYSFNTTATTNADITQRVLTISASGINRSYDGTNAASVTLSDNRVSGDALTVAYTSAAFADAAVGNAKPVSVTGITLAGLDNGNYSFNTSTTTNANITPASLIITANNQSVTYGTPVPATTLSYSGFIVGEDPSFLLTLPTLNSVRSGVQNVGNYAGNYVASGAVSNNYAISYVNGTLSVTPKDLNVTANTQTISYGTGVPVGTVSYNGFIAGENASFLTVQPTVSSTLSGIQSVGSYTANYTASGGVSSNYNFVYAPGDLVVTRRNLNVSADNKSVNYGIAVPTGTFTYSGFIAGEDATFLTTQPTISSALSGVQNAGTYTGNYTLSGGISNNYNFIYTPGTLTVTPTGLNVTVQNRSVTYGTAVPLSSITYTGFITGEDESFLTVQPTISSARSGIQNAGAYLGNYTASGGVSNNYSFNYTAGDLNVSQKPLNVTAGNQSITYGVSVPAGTLTYSGFITGEDASFLSVLPTLSSARSGIQNAGTYAGNYTASGGVSNNYSFNYTAGDLIVTRKTLTVAANAQNIIYGTAVPSGTISYSGFIAGENASFLSSQPTISSVLSGIQNAGSYAGNYTVSGGLSNNYNFSYVAGDLTVGQKTLNVTPQSQFITYGAVVGAAPLSYSGFIAGEDETFLITQPTVSSALSGIQNAGTYAGNYTASGGVSNNYSFNYGTGNLTVARAALLIRANDVSYVYGSPSALNGFSVSGLQNAETVGSVTASANAPLSSSGYAAAGSWLITPSAATGGSFTASNYTITYETGSLLITPRALTISATGINKIQNNSNVATVTLSDNRIAGDVLSRAFTQAFFTDTSVGAARPIIVTGLSISGVDAGYYVANTSAFTFADILAAINPPVTPATPPASALPNTVIKVSQDTGIFIDTVIDDGIYATPKGSYLLQYLPDDDKLIHTFAPTSEDELTLKDLYGFI